MLSLAPAQSPRVHVCNKWLVTSHFTTPASGALCVLYSPFLCDAQRAPRAQWTHTESDQTFSSPEETRTLFHAANTPVCINREEFSVKERNRDPLRAFHLLRHAAWQFSTQPNSTCVWGRSVNFNNARSLYNEAWKYLRQARCYSVWLVRPADGRN